jgi:two-component system, chemotaxis family, CheB/CheR fusion protein
VWLPLQLGDEAMERPVAASRHASSQSALAGLRLLVVDDSSANVEALHDLLALEGAEVAMEASATEAIARGKREPFDLIISDIAMPDIDGYAMLKAIRAGKPNARTPAIAYTGFGSPNEVERAREAGFEFHLTKPIDVEQLIDVIRTATSRHKAAD